ncbi:MAG: nuclear transport factor 2 family protein [Cellvibrio sp.]|uniref:nuclear transport factor 2 family protein n=1 Tax=Cellvibrio sp. TaxID=1965322 RepID=UPI0031B3203E
MNHTARKKPFITRLLLIASLCISPVSFADNKADVQLVSKKVEQLSKAMIDADGKALKQLSSPLLSYGHSGGHIEDQSAFIEKIVSGKSDFVTIELADQTIAISGDVALVRHNLNADIKDGGVPNKIHLGILLVWQKQAGEWKLLARQAFKYPPQAQ